MSTTPSDINITECPYDAQYTNSMNKSNNDDLHYQEMLISSNCNYILIRNPSTVVSLYSISHSNITTWPITDSIWTINNEHFENAESIEISNSGCLSFTYESKPSSQICLKNTSPSTTSTSTTQLPHSSNVELLSLQGNNTIDKLETNLAIIIPTLLCFIGILCIIILLLCHRFQKRKYNHINNDTIGGETHSPESLSDINESSIDDVAKGNVSNEDEDDEYIETEDNDKIDLSDCRPISRDIYRTISNDQTDRVVTQRIVSVASIKNSRYSSDDYYDETTDLYVPAASLKHNVSGDSDLDMSKHTDNAALALLNERIMHKLAVIKDEAGGDDVSIIIRDESLENKLSDIESSYDNDDDDENIDP